MAYFRTPQLADVLTGTVIFHGTVGPLDFAKSDPFWEHFIWGWEHHQGETFIHVHHGTRAQVYRLMTLLNEYDHA
jgi:hypothetical protein